MFVQCVCVCCHPIYPGRQGCARTSRGHTGFFHLSSAVHALVFLAKRIQPFLSLIDREVEFCVLTIKSFSTSWAFCFHTVYFLYFLQGKIPVRVMTPRFELTSQRQKVSGLPTEPPGRPASLYGIYLGNYLENYLAIFLEHHLET